MRPGRDPWPSVRLGELMKEVQRPIEVAPENEYREIGVRSHGRGIFHKDPTRGADLGEKKVFAIRPGDFVFNIVFAWEGAVAQASEAEMGFIGSHRFPTFRLNDALVDARFLHWYFTGGYGLFLLGENSPGSAGRNRTLDRSRLLKEKIDLPRIEEQRSLARLLDRRTTAIDLAIAKKDRLVDLLSERKQALITQAVTGRSTTRVPLTNVENEWYSEVPAGWKIVPIRHLVRKIEQGWSPSCDSVPPELGQWGVLKAGCTANAAYRATESKALLPGTAPRPELEVRSGELIMSRASGSPHIVGSCAIVAEAGTRLMLSDKLFRLRVQEGHVDARYLWLALASRPVREQIEISISGAEGLANNLPQSELLSVLVTLPSLAEQKVIADGVCHAVGLVDALLKKVRSSVGRLVEYRGTLVASALTGLLDDERAVA